MFRINASEVAALVGKNPYKDQREAVQDCWNRNKKGLPPMEIMRANAICSQNKEIEKAYNQMTKEAVKTTNNKEVTDKKKEFTDKMKDILVNRVDQNIQELKSTYDQKISSATNEKDEGILKKCFEDDLTKLKEDRVRGVEEVKALEKVGNSKFNTNFGTRRETNIGNTYEAVTGMSIDKPNKKYLWDIVPDVAVVVGKFDGFAEDGTLVEIKQRTRRLFGEVREYENVQVHVYMKMAKVETAQLVEKYEDKLMVHDIQYDDDFMSEIEAELEFIVKNSLLNM
tara:strand:+ start:16938 stop:17786 length:849 start_codon:yes stop_codon:yes gene_type:complete